MSAVADLLNQSFAAHLAKKRAAGTIDGSGNVLSYPDWPTAENHIAVALTARLKAHDLDPGHADPEWSADVARNNGQSHEQMVAYFSQYLSTDPQGETAKRFHAAMLSLTPLTEAVTLATGVKDE